MDQLEASLRSFVKEQLALSHCDFVHDFDILRYARIGGADAADFIEAFAKQFRVRIDHYRWYHHGGPEQINPAWIFFKPWWEKKIHVPIRLQDLISTAETGEWAVQYPAEEFEPPKSAEDILHERIGCSIMLGLLLFLGLILLLLSKD